ncbi:MAG: septal ring lytic transglycosylase RlpA family protein [Chthoniobacterales bacterium]
MFLLNLYKKRPASFYAPAFLFIALALAGCGGPPKKIIVDPSAAATKKPEGQLPPPSIYDPKPVSVLTGKASYYYGRWIGRKTANGEIYRASDITAAHKTLPFNTMVRVTNLKNGKSVIVRINNRGPFVKGRILDLSLAAAKTIGMTEAGIVPVKAEVLRKIAVIEKPNLESKRPPLKAKPTPTPKPVAKLAPTPRTTPTLKPTPAPKPYARPSSSESPSAASPDKPRKRER